MKFIYCLLSVSAFSALHVFRGVGDSKTQLLSPNTFINLGQSQLKKKYSVNAIRVPHHHGFIPSARVGLPVIYQNPSGFRHIPQPFYGRYFVPFSSPKIRANVEPTTQIAVGSLNNANQRSD